MATSTKPESRILAILAQAKALARAYREETGRPLGVTGEVAEYEVSRLLGIELMPVRQAGYDAVDEGGRRYQIKARCVLPGCKPGQRIGQIDIKKEFDAVLLVLLDENLDALAIYEAGTRRTCRGAHCSRLQVTQRARSFGCEQVQGNRPVCVGAIARFNIRFVPTHSSS